MVPYLSLLRRPCGTLDLDQTLSDMPLSDTEKARCVQSLYSLEHFRSLNRVLSHCGHSIRELRCPGQLDALGCGLSDAKVWQAFRVCRWAAMPAHGVLRRRSTVYRERRCYNNSPHPAYQDGRWNSTLECCDGTAAPA